MTQISKRRLKVEAQRIVDFAGHAGQPEELLQFIAKGRANGELVINMVEYSGRHWWMDYERADLEGVKETAITVA